MNNASCLSLVSNAILYWNTLKITDISGLVLADQTIADTVQADLEQGQANFYYVEVDSTILKANLDDQSIQLSINGDDAWRANSAATIKSP